ncbi:MAG: AMP-binding protein, partial [Sphaerochaeta sp.]|nr:AMP-binding protein [Sphaerochaeta sp.]
MKKPKKKVKQPVWSYRKIRKLKREDGLTLKTVTEYTMESVVECTVSRNAKRIALRTYGEDEGEVTYAQLKAMKDAIGVFLLEHGFVRGDRIALLGESCPTWLIAYFGITSIGCTAVPVLPDFSAKEACQILAHSKAKGVVVNAKHFEKVIPFVKDNPSM